MDIALSLVGDDFDIRYSGGDFASDSGLETAIIISLFSDARVTLDEAPFAEKDRRGWWGDIVSDVEGDRIGSRLWLLKREKLTESVRARAEDYAAESLQWLLDDGVAESVEVQAEIQGLDRMAFLVTIKRPGERNLANFRFQVNWQGQAARGN